MKSQKGISLMSLLVYVVAFVMVSGIIAVITTFFYSNYSFLDENVSISSEYNKLNLCFIQESEKLGNYVFAKGSHCMNTACGNHGTSEYWSNFYTESENSGELQSNIHYDSKLDLLNDLEVRCKHFFDIYIIFSDENFIGWRKDEKTIYYNQSVYCNNVDKFSITQDYKNGKNIISVYVQFDKKSYSTKYTFN